MAFNFCYFADSEFGKVLIPECMAVAVSQEIEDCTCANWQEKNKEIRHRLNEIKRLEEEIEQIKLNYYSKL